MKKIITILLVLVLSLSFVACAEKPAEKATDAPKQETEAPKKEEKKEEEKKEETKDEKIKVGFVVKSLADQYWILVQAGAQQKAAELGVELIFIAPNSESDVQGQVDMIDNLVGQDIDALCVAPSSPDTVLPALERAHKQGIKVLAVDTDTTFAEKLSFIGTGNEAAAKTGGEYGGDLVGSGKNAIILRGRTGDVTHDDRQKGLEDGLTEKGLNILEIKPADSENEKAMNVMQDLLERHDNIDVVCTTADSMAQGAQRAIEAAGLDIPVVGFDGTLPVCELIIEGKIAASVAQYPFVMGVLGVENAVKAVKGETIEVRIDSGSAVVTKDNAQEFMDDLAEKVASVNP